MNEFNAPRPADDQVTQPLRRRRDRADSTDVMSLDDLLEVAGAQPTMPEAAASETSTPEASNPAPLRPAAPARPADPPPGLTPPSALTRSLVPPVAVPPGPPVQPRTATSARRTRSSTRLRQDLTAAGSGAIRTVTTWLDIGDNALVLATAALALFLLLAIGVL